MNLPRHSPDGQMMSYKFHHRASGRQLLESETLASAKSPPWSTRLLGWQTRRFEALKQLLTPLDAAALTARFEAELERLGEPQD